MAGNKRLDVLLVHDGFVDSSGWANAVTALIAADASAVEVAAGENGHTGRMSS